MKLRRSQLQELINMLVPAILTELDQTTDAISTGTGIVPVPNPQDQARNKREADKLRIKQLKQTQSDMKQSEAQAKADKESAKQWDRQGHKQMDLRIKTLKQPIK